MLGLYQAEELPDEYAVPVRAMIEAAVSDTVDPAISRLTRHLTTQLAMAPAEVARRIEWARLRHEMGER